MTPSQPQPRRTVEIDDLTRPQVIALLNEHLSNMHQLGPPESGPAARRRTGAGRAVLAHIVDVARERGYQRLSLETGSSPTFLPAHNLSESVGFARFGRFGDYADDARSVFMSLQLPPQPSRS